MTANGRPALMAAGLLAAVSLLFPGDAARAGDAAPLAVIRGADGTVVPADRSARGLRLDQGDVRFNGIEIRRTERRSPVLNGGYPLHRRSASADILKPRGERRMIRRFVSDYDPPGRNF